MLPFGVSLKDCCSYSCSSSNLIKKKLWFMTSEIAWRQCRSGQAGTVTRQPAEKPIHKRLTLWATSLTMLSFNFKTVWENHFHFTTAKWKSSLMQFVIYKYICYLMQNPLKFSENTYTWVDWHCGGWPGTVVVDLALHWYCRRTRLPDIWH